MKSMLMEVLSRQFRPEFLNRLDETVVFHPLDNAHIRHIAAIQLERLRKRLADRDFGLDVTDAALDLLAEAGFDAVFGARPLKRAIQQHIENPLAQTLLRGEIPARSVIRVDASDGKFSIQAARVQ